MKKILSVLVLMSVLVASGVAEARYRGRYYFDKDDLIDMAVGVTIGAVSTVVASQSGTVGVQSGAVMPIVPVRYERVCNNVRNRFGGTDVVCFDRVENAIYR